MSVERGGFVNERTRNSRLRSRAAGILELASKLTHNALPWLHPDHISVGGELIVNLASYISTVRYSRMKNGEETLSSALPVGLFLLGLSADALDGTYARYLNTLDEGSIDTNHGQIVDVVSDRLEELGMGLSRMASAKKRDDDWGRLGMVMAATANISGLFPSLMRSLAEAKGVELPEGGKNVFAFFGTRAGRSLLGVFGTVYPEIGKVPNQVLVDTILTWANFYNTIDRVLEIGKGHDSSSMLSPQMQEKAKMRSKALTLVTIGGIGVTLGVYRMLQEDGILAII